MADAPKPEIKPRACPVCGKPASADDAPFCSRRCADVDLHRWLGGHYVLPSDPVTDEESDGTPEVE